MVKKIGKPSKNRYVKTLTSYEEEMDEDLVDSILDCHSLHTVHIHSHSMDAAGLFQRLAFTPSLRSLEVSALLINDSLYPLPSMSTPLSDTFSSCFSSLARLLA